VMRRTARWWRRREPWHEAARCWCGWYNGPGRIPDHSIAHGHAAWCPLAVFPFASDPETLADQWAALALWRAAAERARQDEQDRREREADLKRSLAAEEHADVARNGAALASWQSMIAEKITRKWLRPPTAKAGIDCMLNVTQVPGGEVTHVSIGECNGDLAVRESIEAAVYRASPLPPPPDPRLFDRNLEIRFKPD